ncbi:MAG: flagellar basal body-associated FliL family protein [Deltaproteobacteria bacterium]|nr:flagellar basal body-associated FliL family protein [Deltaproteobacteria bacterium]MCW5803163.1 flagellar basal body-associated FliL family protein [Deltaproteobacteria bacterium]
MSDEPPKPAEPAAAAAAGGAAKTSKIVLILLALNLGASGFATFKLATANPAAAANAEHAAPAPLTNEVVGPVVALDPFVVNLDETPSRYLKITLQLELIDKDAEAPLTKSKQLIRDSILSHLSGLKVADTLGAANKEKLRTEITERLEKILGPNKVRRAFFQEFVVQ